MADLYPNIRKALENGRPEEAIKQTKVLLKNPESLPMTIAITGESGSGKSSLVNALRGVDQDDTRAAKTGVRETTMDPEEFVHPHFPQVKVWDLPGIGTMKMTAAEYLNKVGFKKYDVFIIASCGRFRENDAKLGLEIQKMKKKFYFVRSKVDQDMYSEKMKLKSRFNQEKTLREIRDDCVDGLRRQGVSSPKVFLLSSFEQEKYDFSKLKKTMGDEMSGHQRDSLIRAVLSYNEKIIKEKKQELAGRIAGRVTGAVFAGLVPGLSLIVNDSIVAKFARESQVELHLTEQTLKKMSQESGVSEWSLRNTLKLPLDPDEAEVKALIVAGAFSIFGIPSQMIVSGIAVSERLHGILEVIAQDAQNVLEKALQGL